ncbi:hypothetical protein EG68_08374 [Paragonimus skrjabini miyazakii]|uniref:Transmembrane protein 17 n=1 Tax=Paragonimus skrjabini miyazakii TaxID=59628 RepID=A0A8S9YJ77_9TREM|nr:hypothetical protein EG68_08374 [Paragonimus skrjabini miyazakii]
MSKNVRNLMKSLADYVFPVGQKDIERYKSQQKRTGYEYVTNLPLQMLIYFNSFYAPFWIVGTIICLVYEMDHLNYVYRVINIAIFSLYAALEGPRLYLAFSGNLMELVPELVGSWLITLLIELPIIVFLLFNTQMIISPFERSIHIVEFTFVISETILGFFVIKLMVRHQALKFHIHLQTKKYVDDRRTT